MASTMNIRVSVLVVVALLVPCATYAQSTQDGFRLLNEGWKLYSEAHTNDQMQRAQEKYEQALMIFKHLGNRQGIGICLNNLGLIFLRRTELERAEELFLEALTTSRAIKDRRNESLTLVNLASLYRLWGGYARATELSREALTAARERKDRFQEANAMGTLGLLYQDQGEYSEAVDFYQKSLAIRRLVKDKRGEGATLNNLGKIYSLWGQYDRALELYQKGLGISRELHNRPSESRALAGLAEVYLERGEYTLALEHCNESLRICRELKDRGLEGLILCKMGEVNSHRLKYAEALKQYEEAYALYKAIPMKTGLMEKRIGDLHIDMRNLDQAQEYVWFGRFLDSIGRLELVKRNYAGAVWYYEKLLESGKQTRSSLELFTAYTGLGMAYEGMNENRKAVDHYREAVEYTERLRLSLSNAERRKFFDVRVGGFARVAPYEGLARVLLKTERPPDAFRVSEFTKARAFSEALARRPSGSSAEVPLDVLEKDGQLNARLAALKKGIEKAYETGHTKAIETLDGEIREMEHLLSAHTKMLRDKYPLFAATNYPEPMDLAHTAVKEDEWVLSYDVTDPGVLIYLTKGKELKKALFKPVERKEVDELVRKFRDPLDMQPGDSVAKKLAAFDFSSGKKLADLLLSDVLPDLPRDASVIIVPDDSLGVLPFEMLVLNDGGKVMTDKAVPYIAGAEFFGDRNPISYYHSVTALTLARTLAKHQKTGEKTLAIVDPVFSSDDPRLTKLAKNEKDKLLGALPKELLMSIQTESGLTFPRLPLTGQLGETLKKADASKTDLYEGINAQKSVLLEKDLTTYRSVVFATHGYFGKDLPAIQEPVLVLSLVGEPKGQDGFLRLSEVMGLKINCEIAALTACQTGLGRHVSGEGTMGMGRAFQYAGAKSVLMSLWSVAESSSVNLVESFFRHMKEGKKKLEALKLARDAIRKAGYDHPFFWAPFILVGEVQ